MLCVRRWSDAGRADRVRCCREPKTGQEKVQLNYKDVRQCKMGVLFNYEKYAPHLSAKATTLVIICNI